METEKNQTLVNGIWMSRSREKCVGKQNVWCQKPAFTVSRKCCSQTKFALKNCNCSAKIDVQLNVHWQRISLIVCIFIANFHMLSAAGQGRITDELIRENGAQKLSPPTSSPPNHRSHSVDHSLSEKYQRSAPTPLSPSSSQNRMSMSPTSAPETSTATME